MGLQESSCFTERNRFLWNYFPTLCDSEMVRVHVLSQWTVCTWFTSVLCLGHYEFIFLSVWETGCFQVTGYDTCWCSRVTSSQNSTLQHVLRTELHGPGVAGEPGRQRVHQLWHQPHPLCLTHLYVPPGSIHVTEVVSLYLWWKYILW